MKLLFPLSLLLNCVLLTAVAWRAVHGGGYTSGPRAPLTQAQSMFHRQPRASSVPDAPATRWNAIESNDPAQLVKNLRSIGCPEQTIRDLVTFRVCRQYRKRLLSERAEMSRRWEFTRNLGARDWQETNKNQRELRAGMETELEGLLRVPVAELRTSVLGWSEQAPQDRSLSLEAQAKIRDLTQRYQTLTDDAKQGLLPWESTPAVGARLKELEQQKQQELASILTPQELAAYNLRNSPAARYVLQNLPEAKSEEEFQRMVQAVQAVGLDEPRVADPMSRFGLGGQSSTQADAERTYAAKQTQLEALLKQTLGEQRIAEQQQEEQARVAAEAERQRQEDEQRERAKLAALAESVGIAEEDANRFLDRLKELEPAMQKKFEELEKSLDGSEAKSKALKDAIQAELERVAVETLGEKGRDLVRKMAEEENSRSGHP
jgi:hypothetical protein